MHADTSPPGTGGQVTGANGETSGFCNPRHASRRPVDVSLSNSSLWIIGLKELRRLKRSQAFDKGYYGSRE